MHHTGGTILSGRRAFPAVAVRSSIHLIMLPLTYKGTEKNQTAIKECVRLARQIPDKNQETFAPVYISVQRIICPRSIYSFMSSRRMILGRFLELNIKSCVHSPWI